MQVALDKVDANGAAAAGEEGFEVAESLGTEQCAKGEALGRDFEVAGGFLGDLKEEAVVGAAFVKLAGGVEETRAKAEGGGAPGSVQDGGAELLQAGQHAGSARQKGVDGNIVTGAGLFGEGADVRQQGSGLGIRQLQAQVGIGRHDPLGAGMLAHHQPMVAPHLARIGRVGRQAPERDDPPQRLRIDRLAMPELTDAKRQDICTALGIPSTLLFNDAANYATAHQDAINFYDLTVIPLAQRICAAINTQVLNRSRYVLRTAEDELELYQQFEVSKVDALSSMFDRGIITVNEYRERMGMGPIAVAPAAEGEDEPEFEITETEDSEKSGLEAVKELRAWGRFAVKKLKLGRPMRPFETRHVPPVLAAAVRADIEAATTADDVKAIIANAIEWLEYP